MLVHLATKQFLPLQQEQEKHTSAETPEKSHYGITAPFEQAPALVLTLCLSGSTKRMPK